MGELLDGWAVDPEFRASVPTCGVPAAGHCGGTGASQGAEPREALSVATEGVLGEIVMTIERTIAFIDILGFKEKVNKMPLEEAASKYKRLKDYILLSAYQSSGSIALTLFPNHDTSLLLCAVKSLSDTFVLISPDDSEESCLKVLISAWRAMRKMISFGWHPRAAVTFGETYYNPEEDILLGRAINQAATLEKQQKWIGGIIDVTLEQRFPDLFRVIESPNYLLRDIFYRYNVPMKNGSSMNSLTINWRWNMVIKSGTRSILPSGDRIDVREKTDNTIYYLVDFISKGRTYYTGDQNKLHYELRTLWVGDTEPPFPHGDDL